MNAVAPGRPAVGTATRRPSCPAVTAAAGRCSPRLRIQQIIPNTRTRRRVRPIRAASGGPAGGRGGRPAGGRQGDRRPQTPWRSVGGNTGWDDPILLELISTITENRGAEAGVEAAEALSDLCRSIKRRHRGRRLGEAQRDLLLSLEAVVLREMDTLGSRALVQVGSAEATLMRWRAGDQAYSDLFQSLQERTLRLSSQGSLPALHMCEVAWAVAKSRLPSGHFWAELEPIAVGAVARGDCSFKGMSLLLWSFAHAKRPASELYEAVESQVASKTAKPGLLQGLLPGVNPPEHPTARDWAMMAWAYGRQRQPAPVFFQLIATKMKENPAQFNTQDTSNILWAASLVCDTKTNSMIFGRCEEGVLQQLSSFSPQELAMLLQAFSRAEEGSPVLWDGLQRFILESGMPLRAREISAVAWAFANSGSGSPELYQLLEQAACDQVGFLQPRTLSSVCWAFATASAPCTGLFRGIAARIVEVCDDLDAKGTSIILWALSRADDPPVEAAAALLDRSLVVAGDMTPQGVSMVLGAVVALKDRVAAPESLLPQLEQTVQGLGPEYARDGKALAGTFWAAGELTAGWSEGTYSVLSQAALQDPQRLGSQSVANVLYSAAAAGHYNSELFEGLEGRVLECLPSCTTQGLCNLAWAYSTARMGGPGLYEHLEEAISLRIQDCSQEELAMAAWAFAKAGVEAFQLLEALYSLDPASHPALRALQPKSMANLLWALSCLQHQLYPPTVMLSGLTRQLEGRVTSYSVQELAIVLRALAQLDFVLLDVFDSAEAQVLARKRELQPQDVSNILWSFAKMGRVSPGGLFHVLEGEIASGAFGFSPQGLANTVWAYGQVHFPVGADFVRATAGQVASRAVEFDPVHSNMILSGYSMMGVTSASEVTDALEALERTVRADTDTQ